MNYTLHLTPACNMRCDYCYAPPHAGQGMSREVAFKVMDLAQRSPERAGIVFFGGEPLLREDLLREVVAEGQARKRQGRASFHYKITTNGLLLTESILDWSVANQVQIAMSFDGVREAHDRHRHLLGGGPSFDILLPRLRMLLERRPFASVFLVVDSDTASYLADSVTFLFGLGVRYLVVSLDYAGAWTRESMDVLASQYARLADLYVAWSREGRRFYLSPFEVKIASHVQGKDWMRCRCALAEHQLSVDAEGWLYPCVQFTRGGVDWRVGHVDTGIDEASRLRICALASQPRQPCDSCAMADRCQHTCACINYQTSGDIRTVSPVLCHAEQILLPLADRVGELLHAEGNPELLRKHYNPAGSLQALLEDLG